MKLIKYITLSLLLGSLFTACEQDKVEFNSNSLFAALQAQKFDYTSKIGIGKIYQAKYSEDKKTINLDITYFPDETAPTYQDWQLQGTVIQGAKISPDLGGIKDLSEPIVYTITAPDGTKSQVTLVTKIYEVPFGELEHGFGRYNKLFEKTSTELGGWTADQQTGLAVVGDELIINNNAANQPFLVYDKRTGAKKDKQVSRVNIPNTERFFTIFADEEGILHAVSYKDFDKTNSKDLNIYRWKNGIESAPEVFYTLNTSKIPIDRYTAIGLTSSVCGSTSGNAQIMLAMDGRGQSEKKVTRISVINGVPQADPDVFDSPVGSTWKGKAVAMSPNKRLPYAVMMMGFNGKIMYVDNTGTYEFVTAAATSNFLNLMICGACYFEFNHAKYMAISTISWGNDYRLLIFNLDDPTLITVTKADPEKYNILNPFCEVPTFKSAVQGSGDISVQIQPDGKTALVYAMQPKTGVLAYELTVVGAK